MKYRRDYTIITDEDIRLKIKELYVADMLGKHRKSKEFYRLYVTSERDANLAIPEDTRKFYRAQQILLEKARYVKLTPCMVSKMWLEEQYLKENPWLGDNRKINIVRAQPADPNFHFYGDK